jgi:hypothetical protein
MIFRSSLFGLLLFTWCGGVAAQPEDIGPELWDRPRSASDIARHETIKRAVLAALAQPDAQLVIHHVNGQEPLLQAEELRSWLAALAVDPRRIVLRSDLVAGPALRIEVIP